MKYCSWRPRWTVLYRLHLRWNPPTTSALELLTPASLQTTTWAPNGFNKNRNRERTWKWRTVVRQRKLPRNRFLESRRKGNKETMRESPGREYPLQKRHCKKLKSVSKLLIINKTSGGGGGSRTIQRVDNT